MITGLANIDHNGSCQKNFFLSVWVLRHGLHDTRLVSLLCLKKSSTQIYAHKITFTSSYRHTHTRTLAHTIHAPSHTYTHTTTTATPTTNNNGNNQAEPQLWSLKLVSLQGRRCSPCCPNPASGPPCT